MRAHNFPPILNDIYLELVARGLCATRREFFVRWLCVHHDYFTRVKSRATEVSADVLATLAQRLFAAERCIGLAMRALGEMLINRENKGAK